MSNVTPFPTPTTETAVILEQLTAVLRQVLEATEKELGDQPVLRAQLTKAEGMVAEYRQRADRLAGG